jgi:hypothetical protein
VSRDGKRWLAAVALILVLLLGASLSACGDSDSGDSTEATSTSTTTTAQNGGEGRGDDGAGGEARDQPQSQGRPQGDGDSPPPKNVATPLEVSGGGSEQFLVKGGDNSIQEYGEEADESELREVAEIVHGFYVARASGAWSEACSYLSAGLQKQFEQLASKAEVKGCAPFLEAFTTDLPAAVWREITDVDAASLRHEDEQAFLIYRGAKDVTYAMPLYEEGGEWKITALSASALG